MAIKNCSNCGKDFGCGSGNADVGCWCGELPMIMPMDPSIDCHCPPCLKALIKEKIDAYVATVTPETAPDSIAKKYATNAPPVEEIDYYINDDGNFVFTAWYLLKRGFCCKNGCRHCPYDFAKPADNDRF